MPGKRGSTDVTSRGLPSAHDEGTADVNVVADELGELARSLQAYRDMDEVLAEVVRAAVRLIPGVDEASISVVTDRRAVTSRFPSGDLPGVVDALQEQTGQAPASKRCTSNTPCGSPT